MLWLPEQNLDEEVFEFLLYLLTSARVAVDEPKRYGSFRLFQAYTKLLELTPKLNISKREVYERIRSELNRRKDAVASSSKAETKEYADLLDMLIEMMAAEF